MAGMNFQTGSGEVMIAPGQYETKTVSGLSGKILMR
jgi:hypothetical protein